ncbi:hypothetical protein CPB85DRAFT_1496310 [Mucidula mucida]|nr:hypothetical protein CPB85DRAFT_1496310 [Mucidula mucida]
MSHDSSPGPDGANVQSTSITFINPLVALVGTTFAPFTARLMNIEQERPASLTKKDMRALERLFCLVKDIKTASSNEDVARQSASTTDRIVNIIISEDLFSHRYDGFAIERISQDLPEIAVNPLLQVFRTWWMSWALTTMRIPKLKNGGTPPIPDIPPSSNPHLLPAVTTSDKSAKKSASAKRSAEKENQQPTSGSASSPSKKRSSVKASSSDATAPQDPLVISTQNLPSSSNDSESSPGVPQQKTLPSSPSDAGEDDDGREDSHDNDDDEVQEEPGLDDGNVLRWEPVPYHDKSMKKTAADQTMQLNDGEHPAVRLARKELAQGDRVHLHYTPLQAYEAIKAPSTNI